MSGQSAPYVGAPAPPPPPPPPSAVAAADAADDPSDALKKLGNEAFAVGDYARACELYTRAISAHGGNHVREAPRAARGDARAERGRTHARRVSCAQYMFSNRAAARLALGELAGALSDAEAAIAIDARFVKAYHRKVRRRRRQ